MSWYFGFSCCLLGAYLLGRAAERQRAATLLDRLAWENAQLRRVAEGYEREVVAQRNNLNPAIDHWNATH